MSHPRKNSSISTDLENKLSSPKIQRCNGHQTAIQCFLISKEETQRGGGKESGVPRNFETESETPKSESLHPASLLCSWAHPFSLGSNKSLIRMSIPGANSLFSFYSVQFGLSWLCVCCHGDCHDCHGDSLH